MKYIGQPCVYYHKQTSHIFKPSKYDEDILSPDDSLDNDLAVLYKLAAKKFTVCTRIVESVDPNLQDWLIDGIRARVQEKSGKKVDKPLMKILFKKTTN